MFDTVIRAGAVVDRAIIDKQASVGPNAVVGTGSIDDTPNQKEPERLNTGITVVGKRAIIPASTMIGRNVRIGADVRAADFPSRRIKSGGSVEPRARHPHHGQGHAVAATAETPPSPVAAVAHRR
jgi:glucose-1-phosphate adenylyltransferase